MSPVLCIILAFSILSACVSVAVELHDELERVEACERELGPEQCR